METCYDVQFGEAKMKVRIKNEHVRRTDQVEGFGQLERKREMVWQCAEEG